MVFVGLLITLALIGTGTASAADVGVRMSWQEFEKDPKRVESLRKGFAEMMRRNNAPKDSALYRTSYEYWASIHGYFGAESLTVNEYKDWLKSEGLWSDSFEKDFVGITNHSGLDAGMQQTWGRCIHGDSERFMPWHRLYLYYFEKVLLEASGDKDLRLPYWDYTNPSHTGMPAAFSQKTYTSSSGEIIENPLYTSRRAQGWQNPSEKIDASLTDVDTALGADSFSDMSSLIEEYVHGNVHCAVAVCPNVTMGAVLYSSNDPIFWLHHGNIDRLWECWSDISGHAVPENIKNNQERYFFVDTEGKVIESYFSKLFDGSLISYKYDKVKNCARSDAVLVQASSNNETNPMGAGLLAEVEKAFRETPVIASTDKALSVVGKESMIGVPFNFSPAGSSNRIKNFVLSASRGLPVSTQLVLGNVRYKRHPGTMLNIYLQKGDNKEKREYVGTLSFFVTPSHHHRGEEQGSRYSFDVSDQLRRLNLSADDDGVFLVGSSTTGLVVDTSAPPISEFSEFVISDIEFISIAVSAGTFPDR